MNGAGGRVRRAAIALAAVVFLGCGFHRRPEWLEAHGAVSVQAIAAATAGVLAIGRDGRVLRAPGLYRQPWVEERDRPAVRLVAACAEQVAFATQEGALLVGRTDDGRRPAEIPGSIQWGVSALAIDERGALAVVASGRACRVESGELRALGCGAVPVRALAACGPDLLVVDATGALLRADRTGGCAPVPAPAALRAVARAGGRLLAVDASGIPWSSTGAGWTRLPLPRHYRPDAWPAEDSVAEVAMTEQAGWARDVGGRVFALSAEP
jgi:hypothetical protein